MALLNLHPYQNFDLESLPSWRHLTFNSHGTELDEDAANGIEAAFQRALRARSLRRFVTIYFERAREILNRHRWDPFIHGVLGEAFSRLLFYYLFLIRKRRHSLATEGSVVTWRLDPSLLGHARDIADKLEKTGTRVSSYYDLSVDRPLSGWVREHVRPVIESYIGSRAVAPRAHIRVVNTQSFAHTWQHLYREHRYGYYHWDELCYSIPLIVYLDDVGVGDGPYSYIEGSDKFPQNFTIRAFMQAISCKLLVTDNFDDCHKRTVAMLPRIFRGGEQVGSHVDPALFDDRVVRHVTGVAGTAALADGFSLVHGGGHPSAGRRRALFIAHRYPRKKFLDMSAAAARMWWSMRMPLRATASTQSD